MGDFYRKSKPGRSFERNQRREFTMFQAVCAQCGRNCEVPFRPTGDKPVLCSICFRGKNDSSSYGRNDRRNERRDTRERRMYTVVCDECGEECEVPFKPSSDKPIYCSKCFETKNNKRQASNEGQSDKVFEEITNLHSKLDKILKLLEKCQCTSIAETKVEKKKKVITDETKKSVTKKTAAKKTTPAKVADKKIVKKKITKKKKS